MRLIDAEDLLERLFEVYGTEADESETPESLLVALVNESKTVDPVKHTYLKKFRYPGTYLVDYYVCAYCGTTTRGDANFCHKCGAAFDEVRDMEAEV